MRGESEQEGGEWICKKCARMFTEMRAIMDIHET